MVAGGKEAKLCIKFKVNVAACKSGPPLPWFSAIMLRCGKLSKDELGLEYGHSSGSS
jgi:hypothetical protein